MEKESREDMHAADLWLKYIGLNTMLYDAKTHLLEASLTKDQRLFLTIKANNLCSTV